MKKTLLLFLLVALALMNVNAQTTYSRYDVNHDGKASISDVTVLTNYLLGNINYPVTKITLSQSDITLEIGKTEELTAAILPSDADVKTVTWSCLDKNIADVTSGGIVLALKAGVTTIICSADDGSGVIAECKITVESTTESSVEGTRTVNGQTIHTAVGGTIADYVDLGMRDNNGNAILWATHNIGATKPEESGAYIAWSEIGSEEEGYADGVKYKNGLPYYGCSNNNYNGTSSVSGYSKYTLPDYSQSSSWYQDGEFIGDNKSTLDTYDDAAYVNWGEEWRIPTYNEFVDLNNSSNFTWTWNGSGYTITSKIKYFEGKSIFLPVNYYYDGYNTTNSKAIYWGNSLYGTVAGSSTANAFDLTSSSHGCDGNQRYRGGNIRPVKHETGTVNKVASITLSQTLQYMLVDKSVSLVATVLPTYATNKTIVWSSSDESIASVDANGNVSAKKIGSATISATTCDGSGITATCDVLVKSDDDLDIGAAVEGTRIVNGETIHTTVGGTVADYVDLGIEVNGCKVLWATHNLGATKETDYGAFIAWGELGSTEEGYIKGTKTTGYSWSTLKYCNGSSSSFSKYSSDNKNILESIDDAATINWGTNWHTPTAAEFTALKNNCTISEETVNDVKGYRFTSNIEGYTDKSIFFPFAGYRVDTSIYETECSGYYLKNSSKITCVHLYENSLYNNKNYRYMGRSVRPVRIE